MKLENELVKILIVDDEAEYREVLQMILHDQGYTTETAENAEDALEKLKNSEFHIVLTDLKMGDLDGIGLLKQIKENHNNIEVILITGYGTIENAVEAMQIGAYTYFIKSYKSEDLLEAIKKIEKKIFSRIESGKSITNNQSNFMLKTNNKEFRKILAVAEKAARSVANILILGESGVGKEVFARYVHNCSKRKDETFVPVNCSSFSENLLESELFGHEKGAFTGATNKRKGRFEVSHKGTLFLDEIGDISRNTQVKLLRCIETKKVQRIGNNDSVDVDFRLICATNKSLEAEIVTEKFREDLFYRINTITIEIPPLRKRKEDLELLIDFFMNKSKQEMNKEITSIEKSVTEFLYSYDYPGNVRELKNIIDRLVILSEDGKIQEKDLPKSRESHIYDNRVKEIEMDEDIIKVIKTKKIKPLKDVRKKIESEYIEQVLSTCDNNISEAARRLCISRRQLFNKICEYGLKEDK